MKTSERRWINSGGGPLVCIESKNANQWLGVEGLSSRQNGDHAFSHDYERACSVQDYLGLIPLSRGCALVLGDMPLETRVSYRNGRIPLIIRLFYADQGTDVAEMLENSPDFDNVNPVESVDVELRERGILIFDSAFPYPEVDDKYLTLDLHPGKYLAVSKLFEPNERTSLLVHEFRRCEA